MTIKYLSLAIFLLFSLMIKAQGNYGTPERIVQREVIDTGMNHFSAYFYMQNLVDNKEKELFPLLSEPQIKAYLKLKSAVVKSLINRFFG